MAVSMHVSEKHFMHAVIDLARLAGWICYHTMRSTGSTAGYPDLCLVRGPDLLYAELKAENGRLSAPQRHWLAALDGVQHRPEVYVWRPADWGSIEHILLR